MVVSHPKTNLNLYSGHCKQLAPIYAEAAAKLAEKGLYIAKMDGTAHPETKNFYDVAGYPTLKFIKDGVPELFSDRDAEKIVKFVREM